MSSNDRLILLGKKSDLEKLKVKIEIKLKNYSDSLRQNCSTLLIDNLEEMDEKAIQVFSDKLVKQIIKLRKVCKKIRDIDELLNDK